MILVDTDHLSVLTDPRHELQAGLVHKLEAAAEPAGIPIVVVEEQLRGWLAQIRRVQSPRKQIGPYLRLAKLLDFLGDWIMWRAERSAGLAFPLDNSSPAGLSCGHGRAYRSTELN